jgi:hypothetical protein
MEQAGRLELVKDGLRMLTRALAADDTVAVVSFSDDAEVVRSPTSIGEGEDRVLDAIDSLAPQAYLDTIDQAEQLFVSDLTTTLQSVARDAKAEVRFDPELVAEFRQVGFENRAVLDGSITDPTVDGGELGAGHESIALYEVTLTQEGLRSGDRLATVTRRGPTPRHATCGRPRPRSVTPISTST